MSNLIRSLIVAGTMVLGLSGHTAAQERAVDLFARAGGYNAATDLNDSGTADFKKVGFSVGAGGAMELTRYVALRADFGFARNELRSNGADTGTKADRFFYDAAVQLQYPTAAGVTPYLFAGGGGVTFDVVDADVDTHTKGTGTVGLGVSYTIPHSNVGIFVEGRGWFFGTTELEGPLAGFDKTQFDIAWSGGFSYRFPF